MGFESPKFEEETNSEINIESGYESFIPEDFKITPFEYFENFGENIKSGKIKIDEQGKIREDPTAVKELPTWRNQEGEQLNTIAKRVNIEKGEVAKSQNPLHEYEIMKKVKELGLPVANPVASIKEGNNYLILTERIPGFLWRDKDALNLKEKGYTDKDIEFLKQQAQEEMEKLAQEFKEKGIIRSWKLKDMVFEIDLENKKIIKLTPTDWERTKIQE